MFETDMLSADGGFAVVCSLLYFIRAGPGVWEAARVKVIILFLRTVPKIIFRAVSTVSTFCGPVDIFFLNKIESVNI